MTKIKKLKTWKSQKDKNIGKTLGNTIHSNEKIRHLQNSILKIIKYSAFHKVYHDVNNNPLLLTDIKKYL